MKKNNNANQQLSLFDIFEQNINPYPHGQHEQSNSNGRHPIHDETNSGIGTESSASELQSKATVHDDAGTATGEVRGNDPGQQPDTIPEPSDRGILQQHEGTDTGRHERAGRSGSSVAGTAEKGRPGLEGLSNYYSTEAIYGTSFSKPAAYRRNVEVLELLHQLNTEGRYATTDEQKILAGYTGFGGLKEILLDPANDAEWNTVSDSRLRGYVSEIYAAFSKLDPDGSQGLLLSAKRSILNAHYTAFPVISAIYHAVEKAGFKGGDILEPSSGIGNFLAAIPSGMAERSQLTAIEMDRCTGKILQQLYPIAETRITALEKINLPENHFDLVISNVPFGDVPVFDPQLANHRDKSYQEAATNIHNYFFAKSLLLAKQGAMIALITSRYTLDSTQNDAVRRLMADKALFLGAIRLPDTAFKANAGTEVVADIIFLKKFEPGERRQQQHNFLNIKSAPLSDESGIAGQVFYNEYFHNNPSHLLGKIAFGGLYKKDEFNLRGEPGTNLSAAIRAIADAMFPAPILKQPVKNEQRVISGAVQPGMFDSIGNLVALQDGSIGVISSEFYVNDILDQHALSLGINPSDIRSGNLRYTQEQNLLDHGINPEDFRLKVIEPLRVNKADSYKVRDIVALRRLTKELLYKEMNQFSDHALEELRSKLYRTYQSFTIKFGNVLHRNNEKILSQDVDGFIVQALEHKDKLTGRIRPSDILFRRTINPVREVSRVETLQDAITLSLQKYGKLQMDYICELFDKPYRELMDSQKGDDTLIFITEEGDHITRDEYLSGNVVQKLESATLKASADPLFINNLEQLQSVQPKPIAIIDIYAPLHARWIPRQDVQDFLSHLLHTESFHLNFSNGLDTYTLSISDKTAQSEAFKSARKSAAWIINHTLNGVEPVVTYISQDANGNDITVFDAQDTHFAKELYRKVKGAWDEFKLLDPERRRGLEAIYNRTFNTTVLRHYDGSHLLLPGLSGYELRPHQKDTVFRNVQSLGGINDHIVGGGKTLIQVCTAMELRRLGICNKPMITGLKSQIPQLYESFKKAYPLAKVLFPSEKDFTKDNRLKLLNNIATNDWDCIIVSHDQFNMIRQPVAIQEAMIHELVKEIEEEIASTTDKSEKKKLESRLYRYEQKLDALSHTKKDDKVLDFSQLGIDFLMVDESQEFKNLEFLTRKRNVRGLGNPMGSKRAFNMLVACRYLQELHKGDKGILFSSGTPISNTMAELYLLFKYLRPEKMKQMGLTSFDRWAANFANDFSELEYYMGKFKEVHRFREFTNLPELTTMYREIADVRNNQNLVLDKPKAEHILCKVPPSETQLQHIEMLQSFINSKGNDYAELLGLTAGYDSNRKVNPSYAILAINYAKKLSLDPRLIDKNLDAGTKLAEAAKNIASIYFETASFKGTQLVFCDLGTPKSSNSVDNLFNHLEGDIADADLKEIFGESYYDLTRKPSLESVKDKVADVLKLTPTEVSDLVLEANTAENFNAYSELKRLLKQHYIPENQIAFIHDYNTRKQKDGLYEAVNNGDIRIVLGSTKKLGTGVNVQNRCVAGHHLDISWRPSDLEQRNGRFERQGNVAAKQYMEDKVRAFYYATERTLDASMYNTVSVKAHFIAQIKLSSDPEVRVIKDIEEDVDMGHMAAELSGDPIFKEKATLTKKISELEQLNRSFLHKRLNTEDNLKQSQRLKAFYENKITILEKTIPLLDKLPREKDEYKLVAAVKGQSYDKIGAFGAALLREAQYAVKYRPQGYSFELGSLWDFKVMGTIESSFGEKHVLRQVFTPSGEKIGMENKLPDTEMAAGLQVKQLILNMPEERIATLKKLDTTHENIAEYENQLKQYNPYKAELMYCKQRLSEVDRIIIKRTEDEKKIKPEDNQSRLGIAV